MRLNRDGGEVIKGGIDLNRGLRFKSVKANRGNDGKGTKKEKK